MTEQATYIGIQIPPKPALFWLRTLCYHLSLGLVFPRWVSPALVWVALTQKNHRNIKAESIILRAPDCIIDYARLSQGSWPEAEIVILNKYTHLIPDYIRRVRLGERWIEAEKVILEKKLARIALWYSQRIIKGRWKEAEHFLLDDEEIAEKYENNLRNHLRIAGEFEEYRLYGLQLEKE